MSTRTMLIVAGITLGAVALASRIPALRVLVFGGTAAPTGPAGIQESISIDV